MWDEATQSTAAAGPPAAQQLRFGSARARLLLSQRGKIRVLWMRDIEFVQAAGKHVKIYAGGRCHSCRMPLCRIESRLDPACFVRVHRTTLVNVEHIAELHPLFHGNYELILKGGTHLSLSRRYRQHLTPFLLELA
jgi:two-component system LytT family response regulator